MTVVVVDFVVVADFDVVVVAAGAACNLAHVSGPGPGGFKVPEVLSVLEKLTGK